MINRDYIKSYSASYTNNILDSAFKQSPYMQGNDLKSLCNPEQINYNLLKAIFLQWEAEVNRMQNPYFDHDAPAVQNALKTYMQVLSRHIKLDKGSMRPLLQQAVEETIYQVFSPEYFFENFLWPSSLGNVRLSELAKLNRFIKINNGILSDLTAQLERERLEEIDPENFQKKLKDLCLQWEGRWEKTDEYILSFSKVVALNTQNLWVVPKAPEPLQNGENTQNINQKFAKEVRSLNDSLQIQQTTLADKLNEKIDKIDNIKESLNINQKFRLINELYGGDSNEFNAVLEKLDLCANYQEAIHELDNNSSLRAQWDMENEAVKELMDLLSRRFSGPGPASGEHPFSAG